MVVPPFAELHCHSHFSFLDGASAPDDLVARAVELGLTGLAITDHQGLYGAVRFTTAAEAAGLHPVIGIEVELADAAVADPGRDRRAGAAGLAARAGGVAGRAAEPPRPSEGHPGAASSRADPAAGTPAGGEGGPPGDRGGAARAAPRAARAGRDGLAEPVPDGVAREPRRVEGRAGVHPGAARGAPRGAGGAVGVPRGRARAAAAGGRPRGGAGGGGAVRVPVRGRGVGGGLRVLPRALAPPPARRRLARLGDREAGVRAGAAVCRDQRRPLRAAGGPGAPGRRDGDPARAVAGRAPRTCGGRTGSRT